MDRNMCYAGVSVILAGLLGFSWAQGRGALNADEPKAQATDIAVVDLAKVFDSHKNLTIQRDKVREDAKVAQESLKTQLEAAKKLQEELKLYKEGSAGHTRIQKELQEKAVTIQKFQKDEMQNLQQREAEIYQVAYRHVSDEIKRIAEARGLRLVLRTQPDNVDSKDPKKMIEALNRQVLYEKGLDITDEVVEAVNN